MASLLVRGLKKIKHPDPAETDPSKRQCHHFCRNKQLCGHECCKSSVQKRLISQEPTFTSYLQDLKTRNEKLMETPVKRLKLKMKRGTEALNMQQFSYTPKEAMPAAKWIQKPPPTPQQQVYFEPSHDDCDGTTEDFYCEIDDSVDEQVFQTYTNMSSPKVSVRREDTTPALSRIPPNKASVSHADPGTHVGALNVTFDLALDDWDDFSDDQFMTACDESYHQGRGSAQTTDGSVPPVCVEAQGASLRSHTPSRVGCAPLAPRNTAKVNLTTKRAYPEFSVGSAKCRLTKPSENVSLNFITQRAGAGDERGGTGRTDQSLQSGLERLLSRITSSSQLKVIQPSVSDRDD